MGFLAYFNSELKKKTIVYNSAEGVRTKLIGLIKEFWDETKKLKKEKQEKEKFSLVLGPIQLLPFV
jgi:predicted RNA-binding protein